MCTGKLISLETWLRMTYGEDAPTIHTARRWAREKRIVPAPQKHGRTYFVRPDARYVDPLQPSNGRLLRAIYGTQGA
jgi:Excisionase-like protein